MKGNPCFLPPDIGERIPGHPVEREQVLRRERQQFVPQATTVGGTYIFSAGNTEDLPGKLQQTPYTDERAIEAYTGLDASRVLLAEMPIESPFDGFVAVVHYGLDYDNAFWDGTQMVFGDGDRKYFAPFTGPVDICAHELMHGVTGDKLVYEGQSGALNESLSDCFGVVVRQRAEGVKLTDPDAWYIGDGLWLPAVKGHALRDMLNPGTAYNDPVLGRDNQPGHMDFYLRTNKDNGGVHTNSGIPNRAFALASLAVESSERMLAVWMMALRNLNLPRATFQEFAQRTVEEAGQYQDAVQEAWSTVGIMTLADPPTPGPTPGGGAPSPSFPGAFVEVDRRVAGAARKARMTPTDWLNRHLSKYFKL